MSAKNGKISKKGNCLLGHVPQADLHLKILELVSDRIKPEKGELCFDKSGCKSCVSKCDKTEVSHEESSKRDSHGRGKKEVGTKSTNTTKLKAKPEDKSLKKPISDQTFEHGSKSRQSIIKERGKLEVFSQVVSVVVKNHDLELRISEKNKERLTELQKNHLTVVCQLQQQILVQTHKINELETELERNKNQISSLNRDIESIQELTRSKIYSDNHLHHNEALSEVSMEPASLKEVFVTHEKNQLNRTEFLMSSIDNLDFEDEKACENEYLWRIISTQSRQIQLHKIGLSLARGDLN